MASAFCCAAIWRRVLVGLVTNGQSGADGVTTNDLSSKSGELHPLLGIRFQDGEVSA
jgi:hypothetical protein